MIKFPPPPYLPMNSLMHSYCICLSVLLSADELFEICLAQLLHVHVSIAKSFLGQLLAVANIAVGKYTLIQHNDTPVQ